MEHIPRFEEGEPIDELIQILFGSKVAVTRLPRQIASSTPKGTKDLSLSQTESMASWLMGQQWTFFFTFTTRYESSSANTRKVMERTISKWNLAADYVKVFWVMEKHQHRGFHTHGLLDWSGLLCEGSCNAQIRHAWTQAIAGFQKSAGWGHSDTSEDGWHRNRLEICDNNNSHAAAAYCAKYLTKSVSDWDISF